MKLNKSALIVGLAIIAGIAFFPLKAAFSPKDQEEMHQIIRSYLIEHPEVLKESLMALQKKEELEQENLAKNAIKENHEQLFAAKSPSTENATATIILVEFFDYQCHYCKKMKIEIDKLLKNNPNIKVVYKELPVLGQVSVVASRYALAANMQGLYHPMSEKLLSFEGKLTEEKIMELAKEAGVDLERLKIDMESATIQTELEQNMSLAQKLRIRGTPAIIVSPYPMNPAMEPIFLTGATDEPKLQEMINQWKPKS